MVEINTIKSRFLNNIFDQNTYVLSQDDECIIIDAGAEIDDVKGEVGEKKVLAVLLTHAHFDHIWNLQKYIEEFDCDVFVCENEDVRFNDCKLNASFIVRLDVRQKIDAKKIKYYAEKLELGKFVIQVFRTMGHTSDCVCLLIEDKLFTGDTVFADGVGRTDLVDSNPFELIKSLKTIENIKFSTAYPGHYEPAAKKQIVETIECYI